jgi:hypothetical protein
MKVCKYLRCGTVDEAASPTALLWLSEKLAHRLTHFRLCSLNTEHFTELPDEPGLGPSDMGYPMAGVLWMDGAP